MLKKIRKLSPERKCEILESAIRVGICTAFVLMMWFWLFKPALF